MHAAHLTARRAVVRDLTAVIVSHLRTHWHDAPPAADTADRLRAMGDGWWRAMAEGTGRQGYTPSPETVDRVAELVEAHRRADEAYSTLAEALQRAASVMAEADRGPDAMKAGRYEAVAEALMDEMGRAMDSLRVGEPVQPATTRPAA